MSIRPSSRSGPSRRDALRIAAGAWATPALGQAQANGREVIVQAPCGALAGRSLGEVMVFKGLPYAQPPIGPGRFRAPRRMTPWARVRDATHLASASLQPPSARDPTMRVSEDCLYLNIWAPTAPGPHPVFVWVHGGGNTAGSASEPAYDGTKFAAAGIVCVTLGYRLGALGFLDVSSILGPDYAGAGCNALRDQVLALKWVRDNIAGFGGDRRRVTLAGESAGAKNVCALMAIPRARGLFSQAVVESGGGHTVHDPATAASVVEFFLRCADLGPASARQLLDLPSERVLEAQAKVLAGWPSAFPFRPVVDGQVLAERPLDAVARGAMRGKRLLIGWNRDEAGFVRTADEPHQPLTIKDLSHLTLERAQAMEQAYAEVLPGLSGPERLRRLLTAEGYAIPTLRIAEGHARHGATYVYRFDRAPLTGRWRGMSVHASELPFVWGAKPGSMIAEVFGLTALEGPLVAGVHQAWIRFIKTGAPFSEGLPAWEPFALNTRTTMLLNANSAAVDDPEPVERRLWLGQL